MKTIATNQTLAYNIRFISNKGYNKLANMPGTKFVKEMYKIEDVVNVKDKAKTYGIRYCIAGVMSNFTKTSHKTSMFHWYPTGFFENFFGEKHLQKLGEVLQKMPANRKIKGLLIGGLSEIQDLDGRYSIRLLRFLKENTDHIKEKDFTMLLSQLGREEKPARFRTKAQPETAFVYWEKTKTFFVNCGHKIDAEQPKFVDILDIEGIKNHFEFIQTSKNDRFFVGSKRIPNDYLEKNEVFQRSSYIFPFKNR